MTTTPANNGDFVTDEQITQLSAYFFDNVYVMDNGTIRKMDPTIDTQTMCLDKAKIDKMFAENPSADKLKIHLCMHNSAIYTPSDPRYENKVMLVLAAKTSGTIALPKDSGGGYDDLHLCPPNTDC